MDAIQDFHYDRFDVLVEVRGQEAVDFLTSAVQDRFHSHSYVMVKEGDAAYILLDGSVNDTLYIHDLGYADTFKKGFVRQHKIVSSKLNYLSLGLMESKVEAIQSLGMEVIPRTICYNGHNDSRFAQAVLDGYKKYNISPEYLIAGGEAILGLDEGKIGRAHV